ncbi:hypothetical protein FH608_027730 [Nonomuraea phyllanthi]|uniref:Uncharacterized protein n=1 Tax=Nonomuraea phyllanthi TaxID=2219224 RepID=A0A5C4W5P5_9ACTN|nr:hypothetical protein [Nonomuraea phyllanthi]KAB8191762.1 hypothetical protein FH608_027730 [Nonomuraea phyllanthi]
MEIRAAGDSAAFALAADHEQAPATDHEQAPDAPGCPEAASGRRHAASDLQRLHDRLMGDLTT